MQTLGVGTDEGEASLTSLPGGLQRRILGEYIMKRNPSKAELKQLSLMSRDSAGAVVDAAPRQADARFERALREERVAQNRADAAEMTGIYVDPHDFEAATTLVRQSARAYNQALHKTWDAKRDIAKRHAYANRVSRVLGEPPPNPGNHHLTRPDVTLSLFLGEQGEDPLHPPLSNTGDRALRWHELRKRRDDADEKRHRAELSAMIPAEVEARDNSREPAHRFRPPRGDVQRRHLSMVSKGGDPERVAMDIVEALTPGLKKLGHYEEAREYRGPEFAAKNKRLMLSNQAWNRDARIKLAA
eukprot:jgi/Mesvir1/13271/Mv18589-RA.1